ncbi:MAG TPA: ubiquitin-conjugating enzyme E2 [Tepidisphaeraceae bacterium]|nr:ubiquitin-conjugating enzyme E2 [Tepidisphaeraceae bacterium]
MSPRARRLLADAESITQIFGNCPHIRIVKQSGSPPDGYEIEYSVKSLARDSKGKPIERMDHRVLIQLTSDYPRLSPKCSMLTPAFHPNIDESTICVGDHWTAGERLTDLIVRIAEMLGYQAYNIRSPLDGEAAMWADLNQKKLPLDPRNMRPSTME